MPTTLSRKNNAPLKMFHGEQNRHSACLTLCRFSLPIFQKNTPEIKISSPMPMRMTPPSTEALPESLVPNFLPMRRPAMQRKKVTDGNDAGSRQRHQPAILRNGKAHREGVNAGGHALHEEGTGTQRGGFLGLLAPDAIHQHLAADDSPAGQGRSRE